VILGPGSNCKRPKRRIANIYLLLVVKKMEMQRYLDLRIVVKFDQGTKEEM